MATHLGQEFLVGDHSGNDALYGLGLRVRLFRGPEAMLEFERGKLEGIPTSPPLSVSLRQDVESVALGLGWRF